MGRIDRRFGEEGWQWPTEEEVIDVAGLWPMQEYVRRRQEKIVEYIVTRLIFELCTRVEQIQGSSCSLRWWE